MVANAIATAISMCRQISAYVLLWWFYDAFQNPPIVYQNEVKKTKINFSLRFIPQQNSR